MLKPIKGKIEVWSVMRGISGHCVVEGRIFDHVEERDGSYIMTSILQNITGGMVHTLNSRYYLGRMKGVLK